ncbi:MULTISPECIES: restriction endonuclease subunit S [Pseudomonas]|uniref:restriction endonuclease subunit S n=1 Tax=Pseudomonas TaxID=286 RepID=UPI0023641C40|nr:restriction endonuclease subunit S [Pseudomonas putida]MDD2142396.1 restriction endonuclease subunit S [Pseudomonas putida]HDS1724793.1 restriction endonuclease subunit S [Pseudomonas putida]
MSSEWKMVAIGSLCLGIFDGPHATPKKTSSGPIFLGISSLNNGQLDLSTTEHLSEDDFVKWTKRVVPQAGDIVFSYETRLGQVAIIPEGLRCCLGRRMALMRVDPVKITPDYLLYAYLSPEFQEVIRKRTIHGSTVDRIPLTEFGSFPISVPPLNVQKEVVGILRALDSRITLLRETNTTLEAIAKALFKSWFVDFDPVRAKASQLAPEGMDAATAALFPDSLEESELGLVPRGWNLVPFGELLTHTIGGDWGDEVSGDKNDICVAIVRGTDIPDLQSGTANRVPTRYTSAKKLATRALQDGDLVLEVSGGSKDQPTGRSIYLTDALLGQFDCPVVPASFCRLLRPIDGRVGLLLAWHLTYIYAIGKTWEYQNQSTGIANFQTTYFLENELVVMPPAAVLDAFAEVIRPIVDRIYLSKIRVLTQLRDTLLPRLISGQLRLPEAEVQIAEACA